MNTLLSVADKIGGLVLGTIACSLVLFTVILLVGVLAIWVVPIILAITVSWWLILLEIPVVVVIVMVVRYKKKMVYVDEEETY